MIKTKHRGIHRRDYADGSHAYFLRCTIRGRRTWRKAGYSLNDALTFKRHYEKLKGLAGLGFKVPDRIRFDRLTVLYYRDLESRKGKRVATVESAIRKLNRLFGRRDTAELTALEIDQAGLPSFDLRYLKAILRQGKRWGYLSEIPPFQMPKAHKKLDRQLSKKELALILSQASPLHKDAILLSLTLGGLRLGELCKIERGNTDFERGVIELSERKGGTPKRFYLSGTASRIVKRLFLENAGRAFLLDSQALSNKFMRERQKMIGIKPWRFHDLRHTVTGVLAGKGFDVETIRQVLGHSSISVTDRYMHTGAEREQAAIDEIERYIKGLR